MGNEMHTSLTAPSRSYMSRWRLTDELYSTGSLLASSPNLVLPSDLQLADGVGGAG